MIFDYSRADALTGIIGSDTVLATCHPNRGLAEFEFPVETSGLTFPVRPVDEQRQRREIDRLIGSAVAEGASVVVLPEPCVAEQLAAQLQDWTALLTGRSCWSPESTTTTTSITTPVVAGLLSRGGVTLPSPICGSP